MGTLAQVLNRITREDRFLDLLDRAEAEPAERPAALAVFAEAAMQGDGFAAICAGDVARMDRADLPGALRWYTRAMRLSTDPRIMGTIARCAADAATGIAVKAEPYESGPASLHALAWLRLHVTLAGADALISEPRWWELFDDSGLELEDIQSEMRAITGYPPEPGRTN